MPIIHYNFADGHTEEIEVTEEVAAAFEQLEKYEKKVERKETRRHVSLNVLLENGFDFPTESIDIIDTLVKQEREKSEWQRKNSADIILTIRKKKSFPYLPTGKQMLISVINTCISRKPRLQDI